jgi:transposase
VQALKVRVLREVEGVFAAVEHRVNSELQKFDDRLHQQYADLEQEIQYLYESLQLQLAALHKPDQLLKQLISFKAEQRNQQIDGWLARFRQTIASLQRHSVRLTVKAGLLECVEQLGGEVGVEEFEDRDN